jgi:hypothetical protein
MAMRAPSGVAPVATPQQARPRFRVLTEAGFGMTPATVLRCTRCSLAARAVYGLLALRWWQTGECDVALETLREEAAVGMTTLRRYIAELLDHRHIEADRRGGGQRKVYRPSRAIADDETEQVSTGGHLLNRPPVDTCPAHPGSKRPPAAPQASTGGQFKCPPVAPFNRETLKGGERAPDPPTPELSTIMSAPGVEEGAFAPPSPPPSGSRSRKISQPREEPRTPAPDTIEVSRALRDWAHSVGYSDETIASELRLCLAKHAQRGTLSARWTATFRTWLEQEIGFAERDERTVGVHPLPPRRGANGRGAGTPGVGSDGGRAWTGHVGAPVSQVAKDYARSWSTYGDDDE